MLQVSEAEFDRIFQVNVKSIYHSAFSCVPVFRATSARGRAGDGGRCI